MQVAKGCLVGCFAVSRSARIGLIVLALAIAVVGAGAVGMAFLPAAVTEPVVKPVTQSVELLTGDDKPETIKNRLDVYEKSTSPLVDYYRGQGLLKSVNGDQARETVYGDVKEALGL